MFVIWVIFHVLVCIGLILVVLLQSSKGEGLAGSAFGGGGLSGAVFGGRGAATFLSKATSILAVVFIVNCLALSYMSASSHGISSSSATTSEAAADATSPITERAQEERERALQQQQQQQQADSGTADINLNNLTGETPATTPADSSGN